MGRAVPNPFHDFAFAVEMPLRSNQAKLFAVHTLLETGKDPGEEVINAVCHLIVETLASTERMIEAHALAFKMSREEAR